MGYPRVLPLHALGDCNDINSLSTNAGVGNIAAEEPLLEARCYSASITEQITGHLRNNAVARCLSGPAPLRLCLYGHPPQAMFSHTLS